MKKIKYLVFILVIAFASCEDATTITQYGEVNDEATFTSTGQMKLYLMEAYDKLDQSSPNNGIAATSLLTDEVGIGRGGSSTGNTYRFVVAIENVFSNAIWLDNYTVINYCNRIIRGAGLVTPVNAADQLVYNDVLAQTRALRAYCHLQLLTYFSPNMKDDSALGVILMDRVPTILEELQRTSNGAVFALIEADLNFAYANVQPTSLTKPWTYVSKGMINAVRARMYAYRGNYPLAEQFATSAIADAGVGIVDGTTWSNNPADLNGNGYNNFTLATGSPNMYKRMFQDLTRGEMIWSIGRIIGKSPVATAYCVNASNTAGVTLYDMNRNLFNILDNGATSGNGPANINFPNVKDIRRFVNIDPTYVVTGGVNGYLTSATYQNSDNLPIDKYPGITGAQLVNDIKAFRVSEMVFIQAEARVAAGDLPGAALLIKSIRDKRAINGAPALPVYGNATAAWADILLERRLELCFEGHRYIDLKRLGGLANVTIDRHPLDCSTYSLPTCSMPVTDTRFTLPIPLNEISGNPSIFQNPGY